MSGILLMIAVLAAFAGYGLAVNRGWMGPTRPPSGHKPHIFWGNYWG